MKTKITELRRTGRWAMVGSVLAAGILMSTLPAQAADKKS